MHDLVAFYEARLDERELAAAYEPNGSRIADADLTWTYQPDDDTDVPGGDVIARGHRIVVDQPEVVAGHIARHDPARVLADIAADRKLVARYKAAVESHEEALQTLAAARKQWGGMSQETADAYGDTITTSARVGAFLTALEDRAARFSDHEDYQPQWGQP
jgi:hypothetical protein